MSVRYDRKRGMWYRPSDRLILEEVPAVYGAVPVEPGDVLLDLGAHIGATSRLLLEKGIAEAIAVEADPANVGILRRNLEGRPATVLGAAVGPVAATAPFYIRPDRRFVGSLMRDPTRRRVNVPVVPMSGLLRRYRPTIVKADIEFGEYNLPELRALPDFVRVLAMEVHIRFIGIFAGRTMDAVELRARREAAAGLIADVEAQGFREVRRNDKQTRPDQLAAEPDASGFAPLTKAIDAIWAR